MDKKRTRIIFASAQMRGVILAAAFREEQILAAMSPEEREKRTSEFERRIAEINALAEHRRQLRAIDPIVAATPIGPGSGS